MVDCKNCHLLYNKWARKGGPLAVSPPTTLVQWWLQDGGDTPSPSLVPLVHTVPGVMGPGTAPLGGEEAEVPGS